MTAYNNHKSVITRYMLPTRAVAALAVILFLLLQFASTVHAAEHPFHKDDAACDVFVAAEKSKADSSIGSLAVCVLAHDEKLTTDPVIRKTGSKTPAYLSRAPPANIV